MFLYLNQVEIKIRLYRNPDRISLTSFDANAESDNYKVVIVKSRKYLITVDALLLPLKAFCNTFTVLDMISDQNNRFAFTYDGEIRMIVRCDIIAVINTGAR